MTDNDPAVEMVDRLAYAWSITASPTGVGTMPPDSLARGIVAALRSPEGARALFPELAQAVDLHHAWPTRGVDPVLTAAVRVFALLQTDQENPDG